MKKIVVYLIVSSNGSVTVRKQKPSLGSDQVAIRLELEIPKKFFERFIPTVGVKIPEDSINDFDVDIAVALSADAVAKSLNLEFETVEDGLRQMLDNEAERGHDNND